MIYTFYSFKGGVGRSMALANAADRLARRGLRVLVLDFDLEAPGLERYYPIDKTAALATPGLIDLLRSFKESLAGSEGSLERADFRNLGRFIFPIYERVGETGTLDLLSAGCRSPGEGLRRYALDVRTFDWQDFYYNWEGEAFFEWLRRELRQRYDAVLVDSRTGVTEMGGVCAYQLADTVVMLTAANHQNLLGTLDVARDFRSGPVMAMRRGRTLELLVIPSRIEQRDEALLDAFFKRFNDTFRGEMPAALEGLTARTFAIPYEPEYAFEEVVVTDPARRDRLAGLGAAYERLTDALVLLGDGAMRALQPAARLALWPAAAAAAATPSPEAAVQYDPTRRFADYDVFVSRGARDEASQRLAAALQARGVRTFEDSSALVPGDDYSQVTTQVLHHSRILLLCAGAGGLSPWQKRQVELARAAARRVQVVPVLMAGADPDIFALSLSGAGDVLPVDLRQWPERDVEFELLLRLIFDRGPAEAPAAGARAFNPYPGLAAGGEQYADCLELPQRPLSDLLEALRQYEAVLLCGPSGSGKSTLLAAGLVPAVRKGALGSSAPTIVWFDARHGERPEPAATGGDADTLCIVDHIDDAAEGVWGDAVWPDWVNIVARPQGPHRRLVLVARRAAASWAGRRVDMPAADAATLGTQFERPALRTGMAFEPGLSKLLLADAGQGTEPLTLGQLVLPGLWHEARQGFLGNEAYAMAGGVQGAFTRHLAALLERTPQALREGADAVLLWVLQGSAEAGWTWRPGELAQLQSLAGWSAPWAQALQWLVRERALHFEAAGAGGFAVELLFPLPPASCVPVQRLLEGHGERLRLRGALAFALTRWQHAERSAQALLAGQALTDAQRLVAEWRPQLTREMIAFVDASVAATRTQAKRRRGWIGAAGATLALALAAVYAVSVQAEKKRAQLQAENKTIEEDARKAARTAAAVAQVAVKGSGADLRGFTVNLSYTSDCEASAGGGVAAALRALGVNVSAPQRADVERGAIDFHAARDRATAERLAAVITDLLASMGVTVELERNDRELHSADPAGAGVLDVRLPALTRLPAIDVPLRSRDQAELKLVPGGCATLGSDRAEREALVRRLQIRYFAFLDNDKPRETRWLDAFAIQRTEVTNGMFERYVGEVCRKQAAVNCPANWRARGATNEPARFLSWQAADGYCRWIGARLPTEDEWEKAARGTHGRTWPWGDEPDPKRFHGKATSNLRMAPAGSFAAGDSPYGVADLAGSLWELTASPWEGGGHVMKGGSYLNDLPYVRGSGRWSSGDGDTGADYLGFRCVVDSPIDVAAYEAPAPTR